MKNNTIIVDHNAFKNFSSSLVNVVLLNQWLFKGYGYRDLMLIDYVLPWIKKLHMEKPWELYPF